MAVNKLEDEQETKLLFSEAMLAEVADD